MGALVAGACRKRAALGRLAIVLAALSWGVCPVGVGGASAETLRTKAPAAGSRSAWAAKATKATREASPRERAERKSKPKERTTVTAPKPTGNAAAIAFYRKVVAATQAADGVEQLYPPTAPLTQVRYSKKGLAWLIEGPKKAGYAPAADLVFVGASHGKVSFVADSVFYDGIGPAFPPFGLLLTAKGEVLLAGGAPASTSPPGTKTPVQPCVGPTKIAFVAGYPAVGVPFGYSLYGHFYPMKSADKGKVEEVTSTYPWVFKPARTATEVDTIEVSDDLPVAGVIHVSAGGGMPAFTLRWVNKWFHKRLYPPKTNGTCAAYEKGLL
jgi:hypothetical protein